MSRHRAPTGTIAGSAAVPEGDCDSPCIKMVNDPAPRQGPRHDATVAMSHIYSSYYTSSLITGRVRYVRPTSVNPAAANMAMVPVKMADPPTLAALKAATSTG
jgi:hypothetical protein